MANTILSEIIVEGCFENEKKVPILAKNSKSKSIEKIHCFSYWDSPLTRQIIQLFSPKQCSLYSTIHSKYFFSVPAAVEKGRSVKLDKDAKFLKTPNGVIIEIEQKWHLYYLNSIS